MNPVVYDMYVKNAFKSGKPDINLKKELEIITKVITDRYRQKKSTAKINGEVEVSQSTIAHILKKSGYKKVKLIWEPYLTPIVKKTC